MMKVKYPKATMIGVVVEKQQSTAIPNELEVSVKYQDDVVVKDLLSSFQIL